MKKTQETQERQETHSVVYRILLFFFTLTNCVLNFLLNQTASKNTRNTRNIRNAYKISLSEHSLVMNTFSVLPPYSIRHHSNGHSKDSFCTGLF